MFLHISWNTGDILYGKCTCKAGGGGYTNILLPVSIRWLIFFESDTKEVPYDKASNDFSISRGTIRGFKL